MEIVATPGNRGPLFKERLRTRDQISFGVSDKNKLDVRFGASREKTSSGRGRWEKNETGVPPALFTFPSGRVSSPFYSVAAGWRSKDRGRAGSKKKGTRGWRLRWGHNGATDTAKELHVTRKFVYTGVCASAAVMCTDAPRSILLQRRGF